MKAVVMAGGEGSRLRPMTINRPKPLVPVCNRPIMEHICHLLKQHGINEIVATLHYMADEIQNYFGDGSEFGLNMTYSIEDTPLGTAGSVKKAENQLRDGTFVIISGDALTDCNLTKAIQYHKDKGSAATLVLSRVANPLEFGVVITDEEGRVERFLEKPSWSEVFSDTVNTGIYILEPEVFDRMEPGIQYDWSQDIFPAMLREGAPIYGYVMERYWTDVGSLTQYREAQEHLLSGMVDLEMPGTRIADGIWAGPNCNIDEGAVLVPPVCLGRNCKIKAGARIGPYTVLGDNAFVDSEAVVERSVLWDSAYIGPNVGVHSAICGSRVTIKRDSVVNEDAVVGDRCLLDVGCVIRPRIKLWPDKMIERGSTVTMSLVWGNKWRGNLFRDLGVAGLSNIEITPDFATRLGAAFGSCLPEGSRVITSRDSTRSSRMIKRAIIASLLGVGSNIIDLRSIAAPVARHFVKASGAMGAINVRKLPGNSRVTLIEFLDSRGAYLPRSMERKVETTFSREDFKRTDPDDLGVLEYGSRALEGYQDDFFRLLNAPSAAKRLRVVCDYGNSALVSIFPAMLARLGIQPIGLNSFNDAKLAPRTTDEIRVHVENLKNIVDSLGYDMGILFTDEGERLTVVDDLGNELRGSELFAVMCTLIAQTNPEATIAMSVTGPTRIEEYLKKRGIKVMRTKADVRSLLTGALDAGVTFAGDERGGFLFPNFHPGFDAMYSFAQMVTMLQVTGLKLSEVKAEIPKFEMVYESVPCPWEMKGAVMRHITEESRNGVVETLDGIKIFDGDRWVLVLPDAVEPVFHIYAESGEESESRELVTTYAKKIEELGKE
ncbi:MAG: NTP transferase domain-containing protein [Fimbriimonadaceae bacterium]|nr:NTP transferase domain-containing protein [Fimbriimonadaceae bacterium]